MAAGRDPTPIPGPDAFLRRSRDAHPMSIPAHRSISTSTNGLLTIGTTRGGIGGANRSTTL